MINRLRLLYPFLFVVLPILAIVSRNPGASSLSDVGAVLGTMLVGCAVVYGLVALAAGRRGSGPVVPLIVFAAIIWFNWFDTLIGLSRRLWHGAPAPAVVTLAAVVTVGSIWWLGRRPRYIERASTFLALTGLLLVTWSGGKIIRAKIRERQAIRSSVLVKELARPVAQQQAPVLASRVPRRDIYLVVLDEYPNSSVLREVFGFDNRAFEDSLRQLGFTIPRVVRSNYIHTSLSLPSFLNFAHLTRLAADVGRGSNDPTLPNYLLENNRTVAFLKTRGYKFLFFPSQWWVSTQQNRNADWEFQAWSGFDLGREATRSDLRRSYVNTTALNLMQKDYAHDADHVKRTLAGLEQVPALPEPTFAFAHIISPHRPYAVTADCEVRKERVPLGGAWVPSRRKIVIEQLQCVNHLVLRVVTTLLQRSSVAPIILLQGDHGTPTLGYDKAASASAVSPAQARERFGAFGAYYVPGGGTKLFADSVTLVNVFQKVLNFYFDARIPAAPDRLYFSMDETPYSFVEFDPASLAPPAHVDLKLGSEHTRDLK